MAAQSLANGAAQSFASNVTNATLATPQGQAVVAASATIAAAALPIVLPLAVVGGIGYGIWKAVEWLDS